MCVIVCVLCGATRAMRATRARGASTEPVECRKCSRHHRPDLVVAVFHEHEHAGHRGKHRDEHDKLHQLLVDVLNVPSRAQRASAGSPIGHVMAASKSIASAQLVEEAAAIVLVHRHQCQSTCWSTLKALGRPNAAVCLLAVPVDALCCWCDCCACAAAKPLPEPRDVLIRHAGRCRMQGGAVGIGRAGRGRTECRHWTEDRTFVCCMYVCILYSVALRSFWGVRVIVLHSIHTADPSRHTKFSVATQSFHSAFTDLIATWPSRCRQPANERFTASDICL